MLRDPKDMSVKVNSEPAEIVIDHWNAADPEAAVLSAPIRAAAPALLVPLAPAYPLEAEVVVSSVVVPLLLY